MPKEKSGHWKLQFLQLNRDSDVALSTAVLLDLRSFTPFGKKIRWSEGTKATQENIARFPVSPQKNRKILTNKKKQNKGQLKKYENKQKKTAHMYCK